ncbi:hypothetical protein [Candidatus Pelagibacter sp.]|uniref:hypothetical protein n=1 Tax=Candidatus Pelagibacter sp. TaxID=2024849 RepID=UPI003F84C4E4
MKKLFLNILVLTLLFRGSAIAEIIILDCKNLIKDTPQNMLYQTITIDTKAKTFDTGMGLDISPIVEETDKYFKAKHYGSDSETVFIDRYSGVIKIISVSNVNGKKSYSLFEHYKCERTKQKF